MIDKSGKQVYHGAIDDDAQDDKNGEGTNYVAQALDAALAGKAVSVPTTKPYGCSVKYAKK